jgi:hypothetical protein
MGGRMKIRYSLFIGTVIFGLISCSTPVKSEGPGPVQVQQQIKHSKDDVTQLTTETQNKLQSVKNSSSAELVKYEISKIEEYITRSQKLLADGDADQKALKELDDTKKSTSR